MRAESDAARALAEQAEADSAEKTALADAMIAQLRTAADLGRIQAERAHTEKLNLELAEQALAAEREAIQAERASLAMLEQSLASQRDKTAAEQRANHAIAARIASEQAACVAARALDRSRVTPRSSRRGAFPRPRLPRRDLGLAPRGSEGPIAIVMMAGASATLAAQWGLIPRLAAGPRTLILWGAAIAGTGLIGTMLAQDLYGITIGFTLASVGFGMTRPGFTAGASLAVASHCSRSIAQAAMALAEMVARAPA